MGTVSRVGVRRREAAAVFVIVVVGIAAVIAASSLSSYYYRAVSSGGSTPNAVAQGLGTFQSYSGLQTFMAANAKSAQQYNRYVQYMIRT